MGATRELKPPGRSAATAGLVVPFVVPVVPARRFDSPCGAYPAWKGTFCPTTISDSSLSVATRCGVERTFTSEEDWSAWITIPSEGRLIPSAFASAETGPANPVRNPPRLAAERMFWTPSEETRPGTEAIGMSADSPSYFIGMV
jgi:hypothetical protein